MHPARARRGAALAAAAAAALAALAVTGPAASAAPRVTVFGDSVQASFGFTPRATRILGAGLDLRMEADVCRRLVGPGCLGGNPPSVLTVARALGPRMGPLVVVNVGYNDSVAAYDMPAVLRALGRARVRAVVWVTLRRAHSGYAAINARIRAGARLSGRPGYPLVRLVDWDAASAGRPWFTSDGIHLDAAGAVGLARLLRPRVVRTLGELDVRVGGAPIALPATTIPVRHPVRALAGDGGAVWAAGGGRVSRVDARGTRTTATLAAATRLAFDGRAAWLLAETAARPAARPAVRLQAAPAATGVARAGRVTWLAVPCASPDPAVCPAPALLRGVGGGARRTVPLIARPAAVAASPRALWVALPGDGGAAVVEVRAPGTGRLLRTVALPAGSAVRGLAATDRAAFAVATDGRLLLLTRGGRVRVVLRGAVSVAGDGAAEVWALRAVAGRLLRLHPVDGRPLASARVGSRPARRASPVALTGDAAWVTGAGPRTLVRVPAR